MISIKLSSVRIITSVSSIASTVAVLSSSFRRAISQNIFQEFNSAIFCHFIEIFTFHDLIIYHSQFEGEFSKRIISHVL
jgi:hypothetical protein